MAREKTYTQNANDRENVTSFTNFLEEYDIQSAEDIQDASNLRIEVTSEYYQMLKLQSKSNFVIQNGQYVE